MEVLGNNLQYFLAIAEFRSITKAAEYLYISQPSLSKYLIRLEQELKLKLVDRSTSPIQLTQAGELYAQYARRYLDMERQFQEEASQLGGGRVTLHIGVGIWRGTYVLPGLLPLFAERYPQVEVQIREGTSNVIAGALQKGELDLCIMSVSPNYPGLSYIPLGSERILLVGGNSHPFVAGLNKHRSSPKKLMHAEISDLRSETFLLTTKGQNFAHIVENFLAQSGIPRPSIMRIENLTTGVHLAAQGKHFTFLPDAGLRYQTMPSNVTCFTVGDPQLAFSIAVAIRKDTSLSWAAQALVDTIREQYASRGDTIDVRREVQ